MSRAAVFLDRDGVIVELVWDSVDRSDEGVLATDDVELVSGAADALRRIRALDYRTVVVSNQPGVAKGKATRDELREVHERVVHLLQTSGAVIDDYRYCLHHPESLDPELAVECDCRKPKPGLLLEAAAELEIDLTRSWMIGDSDSDVAAGRAAGCTTILVENPRSSHRRTSGSDAHFKAADVAGAVEIVANESP